MDDDPKIVQIGNTFIYIYIYKDDSGGGIRTTYMKHHKGYYYY